LGTAQILFNLKSIVMDNLNVVQLDFGFEYKPIPIKKKILKSSKKRSNDFVFNFMDCLTSPIIIFKSAWQDTIPKDILKHKIIATTMFNEARRNGIAYRNFSIYDAPNL